MKWSSKEMVGELVFNEDEGKPFFTIKMIHFRPYSQYSNATFFHYDKTYTGQINKPIFSKTCGDLLNG
jgi:hypothetical protein